MITREHAIPLSDRASWERTLETIPHAFGHSWESCHAMARTTGWRTFLYAYEASGDVFVCPYSEREFRGEIDVVTPYGFSGFTGHGDIARMLASWKRFACERGYVCGYLALNPLLAGASFDAADGVVFRSELFFVDLNQSPEALLAAMSQSRRKQLRLWQDEPAPIIDDRASLSRFFIDNFKPFMESRGASAAYDFSRETLALLASSPNSILLGTGTGGQIEAAVLFCCSPLIGEYMFSVARPGGERFAAPLIWAAALELKARKVRWLSLGGGASPGDGVAEFKRRFGAFGLPMPALRQIYRPDRFSDLCGETDYNPAQAGGYFPPYYKV